MIIFVDENFIFEFLLNVIVLEGLKEIVKVKVRNKEKKIGEGLVR